MFIYYLNTGYSKVLVIRPPIGPANRGLNSKVFMWLQWRYTVKALQAAPSFKVQKHNDYKFTYNISHFHALC